MQQVRDIESLVQEYPDTKLTIIEEKEVTFEEMIPQIELFFFVKQMVFFGYFDSYLFFKICIKKHL
jgi:hypothetical protein